jgi:RNA polymerase-binding transcription factor DksA
MARSAVSLPTVPVGRCGDDLASRLPDLRAALERQRDFRREQLAQVDLCRPSRTPSATDGAVDRAQERTSALREVEALVAAGARRALTDIELALARIHTGDYGCCRVCGTGIPLAVLEAIPKTTLCLVCQQSAEHGALPAHTAFRAQRRVEQGRAAR